MKQLNILGNIYYLTEYDGRKILLDLKEFNSARARAGKYSLELSQKPWWRFW